jgi:regulator of protease activity HflC (stomatin/prohibitin superfamily)
MRKMFFFVATALVTASLPQAVLAQQGRQQEAPRRSAAEERRIAQSVIDQAISQGLDIAAAVEAAVEADPDLARAFAQIARSNQQVASAINEGLRRAFTQIAQGGETGFPGGGNSSPYIPYMSGGNFGGGPTSPQ